MSTVGHVTTLTASRDQAADTVSRRRSRIALGGWALLVVAAFAVGLVAHPGYPDGDWLPPLHATRRAVRAGVLGAVVFAVAAAWVLPRLARTLRWRPLLLVSWLVGTGWAVLLASSSGWAAVAAPMAREQEYIAALPGVGSDPLGWLDRFEDLVATLPTHPAGHPPLPVLVTWAMDRIGLGGPVPLAALCIAVGASSVVAVLVTVRTLGTEQLARRAAPFVALAPFALTVATSMDAFFTGVAAWGVAALAVASARGSMARGSAGGSVAHRSSARPAVDPFALVVGVLAGVLLASVLYLNYGLVVVGALAVAVVVLRPVPAVWIATVAGGLLVVAAFTIGGFWWFDGVAATADRWAVGTGSDRPYLYTVFGNLAVFGLLTGPATAAAIGWVRDRVLVFLAGSALVALLALDVSGVTRGEVERIWLPLAPWAVVITAALPPRWVRPALLGQVAVAAAVQTMLRLSW